MMVREFTPTADWLWRSPAGEHWWFLSRGEISWFGRKSVSIAGREKAPWAGAVDGCTAL